MFAALFTRSQDLPTAVAAKADPAAFERWADDDAAAEQDHSLPVPWDWWTDRTTKN